MFCFLRKSKPLSSWLKSTPNISLNLSNVAFFSNGRYPMNSNGLPSFEGPLSGQIQKYEEGDYNTKWAETVYLLYHEPIRFYNQLIADAMKQITEEINNENMNKLQILHYFYSNYYWPYVRNHHKFEERLLFYDIQTRMTLKSMNTKLSEKAFHSHNNIIVGVQSTLFGLENILKNNKLNDWHEILLNFDTLKGMMEGHFNDEEKVIPKYLLQVYESKDDWVQSILAPLIEKKRVDCIDTNKDLPAMVYCSYYWMGEKDTELILFKDIPKQCLDKLLTEDMKRWKENALKPMLSIIEGV